MPVMPSANYQSVIFKITGDIPDGDISSSVSSTLGISDINLTKRVAADMTTLYNDQVVSGYDPSENMIHTSITSNFTLGVNTITLSDYTQTNPPITDVLYP